MLELKNICKSYTTGHYTQKALDNVSVTFRDSEFVAVLGPSGSGKTTLLNVIGGLDHYDSGDLIINGVSTKKYKDKDWDHYRNNQLGFVFQNYNLIPHQSVLSNVELALTLSGISPAERKRRATHALDEVGLKDHLSKKPNQLSGGQQQRVAIARAIVNNPSIIFADEPTGALDTKTSVQIMDILKKISKDRLVVMVTHNPNIAKDYATRIVNLQDAKIIDDSQAFNIEDSSAYNKKNKSLKKGKTSMSFFTALSLSFANLMGKWGRTIMTAFAGSIGIIGISAILALSTGTNLYIKNVEGNTLSQYPLEITRSKSVISEFMGDDQGGISNLITDLTSNKQEDQKIGVRDYLTKMLSASGSNDLKSLKAYLDKNKEELKDNIDSIEYKYSAQPLIYADDDSGVREVHPTSMLSSLSGGSRTSASTMSNSGASSMMGTSATGSMSGFSLLPKDSSIYDDKYSVDCGRWPANENECVLVLHQDGTISDSLLYTLGLRPSQELNDALSDFSTHQKVNLPQNYEDVSYSQIIGKKFKLVNPSSLYAFNESLSIWEDKTSDKSFLEQQVKNSQNLEIVGIIKPPSGTNVALSLTAGINLFSTLGDTCIKNAANSRIVQDQLSRPLIDVLTGKTFEEEKSNNSLDGSLFGEIFDINYSGFVQAFNFEMPSLNLDIKLSDEDIKKAISDIVTPDLINEIIKQVISEEKLSQDFAAILTNAVNNFLNAQKDNPSLLPEQYFSQGQPGYSFIIQLTVVAGKDTADIYIPIFQDLCIKLSKNIITVFSNSVIQSYSNIASSLASLNKSFSFDSSKLKDVFKVNLTPEKLMSISKLISGSSERTYHSNLVSFGYSDIENPDQIFIYPKDFYSKDEICAQIDSYNQQNKDNGHEDNVISYTDFSKLLINSITTMIDMITAVLIAFVGISLLVSSIMIGIITYISVLERRREIGILRAIGARKIDIFNVFNAETFIIGLIAGIMGIIVTWIGCIPANILAKTIFDVEYDIAILPLWAALILIIISIFLTFIAGLIPSSAAAKKDPVEAINS